MKIGELNDIALLHVPSKTDCEITHLGAYAILQSYLKVDGSYNKNKTIPSFLILFSPFLYLLLFLFSALSI